MKKILNLMIFTIIGFILCGGCFSYEAKDLLSQIYERGYVKVSTNAQFEPFEYQEGDKIIGIDIEIAEKIAENLGVDIQINDVSFDSVVFELNNHNCDFAIAAIGYSDDKALSVDFSDPYYYAKQVVMVSDSSSVKSVKELGGKKIGVILGFTGDTYCTNHFENSDIQRYNKAPDAVLDLVNGRIDAVVLDDVPAKKLLSISDNKAKILEGYLTQESYHIAVPKGETKLLASINSALSHMNSSGETDEIINKYINTGRVSGTDIISQFYNNIVYKERYKMILKGLAITLEITVVALAIGIFIGLIISLVKVSRKNNWIFKILKFIADFYITIIRGTPVLVQLFVIYYLMLVSTGINKIGVAMIVFGVNSGAYVAEIIRSGVLSIDKGQYEAGRSLGLSEKTTMSKIIFPQVLKNILPTLVNEFIQLIKETSVAGFIGVTDLSRAGDIIRSQTYQAFVPLVTVAIIYLVLIVIMTGLLSFLERRLHTGDKS